MPQIFSYLDAQLVIAKQVIEGFNVNEAQMERNIELQGGQPFAEKIMFELGKAVGKQTAHKIVYDSAMKAFEQHLNFLDLLCEEKVVRDNFSREELIALTDPTDDLGNISERIDLVLGQAEKLKNK